MPCVERREGLESEDADIKGRHRLGPECDGHRATDRILSDHSVLAELVDCEERIAEAQVPQSLPSLWSAAACRRPGAPNHCNNMRGSFVKRQQRECQTSPAGQEAYPLPEQQCTAQPRHARSRSLPLGCGPG